MPRHEQKLTVQSPLSQLSKPGAMRQDTLPGLPPPHDASSFSIPRIAFILRRGADVIKSFRSAAGRRGHTLKTEHQASGFTSSLSWSEGDNKKVVVTSELTGNIKMAQEGGNVVFTNDAGATLRYHHTGASVSSPVPLKRAEQVAQQDTPWYLKTAEAVGRSGLRLENIEAEIIEAPAGAGVTKNDKPVARFKLRMLGTAEPVELPADVYNDTSRDRGGNPYRIQQTLNKKLAAGEKIVFTGHYHVDKTTFQNDREVKPFERRWVRLIVIDRKATG